jgi:outer membrane lipoprotein-sorting protein
MNCAECHENLVACVEGLLDREESLQYQAHLETCAACRAEHTAITRLQQRLVTRGQAAAEASIVAPVMQRIRAVQPERESNSIMSKLFTRWGFGLGAAAGAAAIILAVLLISPNTQATAAEVMAKGARAVAKLTSIHLRGKLRTLPADNFSYVSSDCDFHAIELWKQFEPELKWRVEKPGRITVMDGQSTVLYIKTANSGMKLPQPSRSAFDTEWLHKIANLSNTITNELNNALAKGWKLSLAEERGTDGRAKAVVTVEAKAGLPDNDYLKNKFFDASDTRRVYRFDAETELLEAVQVYLKGQSGEVLMFELEQIEYNQPIAPTVFQLDLPANVNWYQTEMQKLPDNEKYAAMTAEQAAHAYFEALGRQDWTEAEKFRKDSVDENTKQIVSGLELVSIGKAFASAAYDPDGRFVPYEIKFGPQINVRVSNTNPAKRCVVTGFYDSKLRLQQDFKWSTEPEALTNNDAYARLSPAEAVKAYFDAQSKLDWVEMRKFTSEFDVEETKKQIEAAEKQGMDVHKMPVFDVGEATWSPEQSAWFVKCRMSQITKHNLALKKDPKTGRWFVDGGGF